MTWQVMWPVLSASAVAGVAWGLAAFFVARIVRRNNVIDTFWSLGFALIAIVAFAASLGHGNATRRLILVTCTVVWALRLGWFVGRRSAGRRDDQRYVDLLSRHSGGPVILIFIPQTMLLYFISLTLQIGLVEAGPMGALGSVGVAIWMLGICFESVGDMQMSRFRADQLSQGKLIDQGLWRWTRHPNYFGDAAVWAGLYMITAERWPGVLTIGSPVVMIYLLVFGSGARLLERSMRGRPGYADYVRRTSGFVPVPPALRKLTAGRRAPVSSNSARNS